MGAWAFEVEPVDPLDRAVERDPGHDLREREMPRLAAYLPHAAIGLLPDRRGVFEQFEGYVPGIGIALNPIDARGIERIGQLAVDIELQLLVRGVADPHRGAAPLAGRPSHPVFGPP